MRLRLRGSEKTIVPTQVGLDCSMVLSQLPLTINKLLYIRCKENWKTSTMTQDINH